MLPVVNRCPTNAELALGVLLSIFCSTSVWYASSELSARRQHRAEAVQHQLAIIGRAPMQIDGQPGDISEYRSRVLVPYLLVGLSQSGLLKSDQERFMAVRLVTGTAFFLAAYVFAFRLLGGRLITAAGFVGILSAWLVASFNAAWEIPTEFPDLTFLLGAVICVVERRRLALVALTVVATLNRESSVYYAVLWFWMYAFEGGRAQMIRQSRFAALIGIIAITETLVLRASYRLPGAPLSNHSMVGHNLTAIMKAIQELPAPGWFVPLVCGCAFIAVWWWMYRVHGGRVDRALMRSALTIALPSVVFASVSEIRVFLPSIVLALSAVLIREQRAELVDSTSIGIHARVNRHA